jgi:hypothetical protein
MFAQVDDTYKFLKNCPDKYNLNNMQQTVQVQVRLPKCSTWRVCKNYMTKAVSHGI